MSTDSTSILTLVPDQRLCTKLRVWGPLRDCVGGRKQNGGDREWDRPQVPSPANQGHDFPALAPETSVSAASYCRL
jgi:hypothetical protein